MKKTCVICGKEHNCREYTYSDECHELFKQKLIIEKGLKQEDLKNYPIVGINRLARRAIKARELKQQKEKIKVSWINLDTGEVEEKEMTEDEYKKKIGF